MGKTFPVVSVSTETVRIARAIAVMQRRPRRVALIRSAGVYNCKSDGERDGKTLWSAHAFGDAVDLMLVAGSTDAAADLRSIAMAAVADATRRTRANRGRRTQVTFVIYEREQWVKGEGWRPYTGVPHVDHVHVACSFSTTDVPACSGGHNLPVPYVPPA